MDSIAGEVWFLTGSQHLYGEGPLEQVAANSRQVVEGLNSSGRLPLRVVFSPVRDHARRDPARPAARPTTRPIASGVICWMHTFSPAKMWIAGLRVLRKPLAHLHTQFNRDLPWGTIDMDFMNLNQAAHGDREFGFIYTRMRIAQSGRRALAGHGGPGAAGRLDAGGRAAWHDLQGAKFARFGDNMRQVAVTEGDKVAAQMRFGISVNGYGVGDLVQTFDAASDAAIDALVRANTTRNTPSAADCAGGPRHESLRYGARIELGLRNFLEAAISRASPRRSRTSTVWRSSRAGRAAADGRRLRVRRRGRLEDLRPGAGNEGDGGRA